MSCLEKSSKDEPSARPTILITQTILPGMLPNSSNLCPNCWGMARTCFAPFLPGIQAFSPRTGVKLPGSFHNNIFLGFDNNWTKTHKELCLRSVRKLREKKWSSFRSDRFHANGRAGFYAVIISPGSSLAPCRSAGCTDPVSSCSRCPC